RAGFGVLGDRLGGLIVDQKVAGIARLDAAWTLKADRELGGSVLLAAREFHDAPVEAYDGRREHVAFRVAGQRVVLVCSRIGQGARWVDAARRVDLDGRGVGAGDIDGAVRAHRHVERSGAGVVQRMERRGRITREFENIVRPVIRDPKVAFVVDEETSRITKPTNLTTERSVDVE